MTLLAAMIVGQGVVPAGATWQTFLEPELISNGFNGGQGNLDSFNPQVSDNGRYVVFESRATNLTEDGSDDTRKNVFRYDRLTETMVQVNAMPSDLGESERGARDPRISDDGRYVLFFTGDSFVEDDTNGGQDFYVRDMVTGEFKWIDFYGNGEALYDIVEHDYAFSGDGSYIVFHAWNGDLLVTGMTDASRNVWGYDIESDEATLVCVPEDGYATRGSRSPAISDDGRYVAFLTGNSWDEADENGEQDIYVRDMTTGDFRWVDFAGDGSPLDDEVYDVVISGDGTRLAFVSWYQSLLPDDTDAQADVYTYDLASEESTLVSGPHVDSRGSRTPMMPDDGRFVMFYTGQALDPADTNDGQDLYVRDMETGELSRVGVMGDAALAGRNSIDERRLASAAKIDGDESVPVDMIALSGDGGHIVFDSDSDLGSLDKNLRSDVFYWRFVGRDLIEGAERVAGRDRYATAAELSRQSFPNGASSAVIACGENWPDALCGAGLAGAVDGPMLLTRGGSLTAETKAELTRLGAKNVYLLGGYDAIDPAVEAQLDAILPGFVWRIGGPDRFATSRAVANRVIELLGARYDGTACVTTGLNFPDAVGVAPLSAGLGWPVVLVRNGATSVNLPPSTDSAVILGGGAAVAPTTEAYLKSALGAGNVARKGGANRYETSAIIAQYGVDNGLQWDGVGISTGTNFPDALAGGAALGLHRSPLLLTPGGFLHPAPAAKLTANKADIESVGFLGGASAVSTTVVSQVKALLGL